MESIDIDLLELIDADDKDRLSSLTAEDIKNAKAYGILKPVIVKKHEVTAKQPANQKYRIIGETKSWLLAQEIGTAKVPIHIIEIELEKENEVRKYFRRCERNGFTNAIEEARNIKKIKDLTNRKSNAEIAAILGKTRTAISHKLRLLTLSPKVIELIEEMKITEGQARPLVTLKKEVQNKLVTEIISRKMTVREIEKRIRDLRNRITSKNNSDINTATLEGLLSEKMGSQVNIKKGKLIIDFQNNYEILEGILSGMGVLKY